MVNIFLVQTKCVFILVLLCPQLYRLRAVQFNARSACDASMLRKVMYVSAILWDGSSAFRRFFQNPLPADSFSKYKTKVIPNKVCIMWLYTINYCIFRVIWPIFSRNFTSYDVNYKRVLFKLNLVCVSKNLRKQINLTITLQVLCCYIVQLYKTI